MPEHADESADGDSQGSINGNNNSNNNLSTSSGSNADSYQHRRGGGDRSSNSLGSSTSRFPQQLSSLEATPEEEGGESSDESYTSSNEEDTMDKSGRSAKERRSRQHRSTPGLEGSTATLESSTGSNDLRRRAGGSSTSSQTFGRQRGDIEKMPDPSLVDWEVAVVMASSSADDMVRWTVARRG